MVTYLPRSAWGARPPEGSRALDPDEVVGNALHYPGMAGPINAEGDAGFRRVASALRGWQAYHMDNRGWSDIAYGMGFDQAGRIWTLRGINIRTGANGDARVNSLYGAFLLIIGNDERPSAAMQASVRAAQADFCRRFRGAPDRPTTHGRVRAAGTRCPGPKATADVDAGKFDAGATLPTAPTKDWLDMDEKTLRAIIADELNKQDQDLWINGTGKSQIIDRLVRVEGKLSALDGEVAKAVWDEQIPDVLTPESGDTAAARTHLTWMPKRIADQIQSTQPEGVDDEA